MRSNAGNPAKVAWLVIAGLLAFMAAFAIGCGSDDSSSDDSGDSGSEALTELGKGEGEVNLVAWAGYVEDGSTDPKVDWVSDFEKETGCQVNVKIGNTSDEMVQLMRTGQYDAVSASGDATLRLIEGGDVDPVNTDLVPNYADVFPGLKDQPYNSVDGQMYGIPHGRGANLLVWNSDVVKPDPTSWGVVFDQSGDYSGKVTAYDNPIYIADASLYLMKTNPDYGTDNPYELDDDQLAQAVDLLKEQNANIGEYWSDYTKNIQALENGDTVVGTAWPYNWIAASAENPAIKQTIPDEGSTGWSDTWMISSESEHPNCTYMWFDHILDPQVQASVAEWFGEAPANSKACEKQYLMNGPYPDPNHCKTYDAAGEKYLDDLYYWTTPISDCGDDRGDVCTTYDDWVQAWTEVKG
jgi:putative spermidine/putrescine transport system substrate-binding protein